MLKQFRQIKNVLEKLYGKYNRRSLIKPDPLQFVYRYSRRADMEVAAFLAASLAYGRVQQIEKSLTDLFGRMGNSPSEYVRNLDGKQSQELKGFKHRFTDGDNILDLLRLLQIVLNRFWSIEEFFVQGYESSDENIIPALSRFCDSLTRMYIAERNTEPARGLKYLLASPNQGSACKRLNLFLRWMVRDDDVDTGLWKSVDKARLVVPVDVHISRLCRILGFCNRKTISLSGALEITDSFRQIEPDDPVKYDFALSRIGIVENCSGRFRPECRGCELYGFCLKREN